MVQKANVRAPAALICSVDGDALHAAREYLIAGLAHLVYKDLNSGPAKLHAEPLAGQVGHGRITDASESRVKRVDLSARAALGPGDAREAVGRAYTKDEQYFSKTEVYALEIGGLLIQGQIRQRCSDSKLEERIRVHKRPVVEA